MEIAFLVRCKPNAILVGVVAHRQVIVDVLKSQRRVAPACEIFKVWPKFRTLFNGCRAQSFLEDYYFLLARLRLFALLEVYIYFATCYFRPVSNRCCAKAYVHRAR